ncbi:MAG: hypothetical protein JSR57_10430, partial [Verrucomicrobia bacterium]|nr:hypothetical protein [Verrucomicrobiota bacterium]
MTSSSSSIRSSSSITVQPEEPTDESARLAATALGRILFPPEAQDLEFNTSLFSFFLQKTSEYLLRLNSDRNFFKLTKTILTMDELGPSTRFISHFEHPKLAVYHENEIFNYQGLLYIFYRFLAESIPDDRSENADFRLVLDFLNHLNIYLSHPVISSAMDEDGTIHRFLDSAQPLLSYHDPDLLQNTPSELGLVISPPSKTESYRSTIKNFITVYTLLYNLLHYLKMDQQLLQGPSTIKELEKVLIAQTKISYEAIAKNKAIPTQSKVELFFHMRRLAIRIGRNFNSAELMKGRMFGTDALQFYQDVICSKKAQQIAKTLFSIGKITTADLDITSWNPDAKAVIFPTYAEENREAYEFFIPRLREMTDYLSCLRKQAKNDLFVIQQAPSFFRNGNVENLLLRLKSAKGNQEKADAIILDEMKRFSLAPRMDVLGSGEIAQQNEFEKLEELICSASKVIEVVLSGVLRREKEWNSNLFDQPYTRSSRPQKHSQSSSSKTHAQLKQASSSNSSLSYGGSSSSASSSSQLTSPSTEMAFSAVSTSSSSSSSSSAASVITELNTTRALFQGWLANLSKSRSPLTAEALKNSYEHFDNLLSSIRRAHLVSLQGPMTHKDMFAMVNDTIRHCTLGVEQLLSALYRETNGIKTKEALAPDLTHDLFLLLQRCNMGKGDLSPEVRKWISEINRGEIIVRNSHLVSGKDTVLHNLLRSNYRMMSPSTSSSSSTDASEETKPLMEALFDYLNPLGELLETIQDRFPVKGPSAPISLREPLHTVFKRFCTEMDQAPITYTGPLPAEGLAAHVDQMRSFLISKLSSDFNGTLDNILQNLLVHLETELQSQEHLEPIEASLHLGNILLLDQMIAEGVLLHAVHSKTLPLNLTEESDHDLFALVQKLKIEGRFSKEELDFLKSGKTSRQFIRYPASYSKH